MKVIRIINKENEKDILHLFNPPSYADISKMSQESIEKKCMNDGVEVPVYSIKEEEIEDNIWSEFVNLRNRVKKLEEKMGK